MLSCYARGLRRSVVRSNREHTRRVLATLVDGKPLSWEEAIPHLEYVREHGIKQFVNTWKRVKDLQNDTLFWGEETEMSILALNRETKEVKLSLRGAEIRDQLNAKEDDFLDKGGNPSEAATWHPEYGSWMIESTPKIPYSGYTSDLLRVEESMRRRRSRLLSTLNENEIAPTITSFPMMGVGDFTTPSHSPGGPIGESRWVPDAVTNPHPRFGALTRNIRKRRGSNVDIRIPLYIDKNTFNNSRRRRDMVTDIGHADPSRVAGLETEQTMGTETNSSSTTASASNEKTHYDVWLAADDEIVMDHMAFGMGCSCLQVTFQARDIDESRRLFDTLVPFAPLMLALTAAAPIFKGQLADTDVRWNVIGASVDDRTVMERGKHISRKELNDPECPLHLARAEMAGGGMRRIMKSRYGSVSNYICAEGLKYNDLNAPFDRRAYKQLKNAGVDEALSRAVSHLFIRDPLVIHDGLIELDDTKRMDHFENVQSTNWQTLRWKPPPPPRESVNGESSPHVGWRTEFRSMELQLTDFENAAFSVFAVLVSRVILAFDLNTYIPISLVDENMRTAHRRSACRTERFWFRRHMSQSEIQSADEWEDEYELMSLQQIMLGKGSYFPGLIPMVFAYLDATGVDGATRRVLTSYLQFIQQRVNGELLTTAEWMRNYVTSHPDYRQDSVVTQRIAFDLMERCHLIGNGEITDTTLLPKSYVPTSVVDDVQSPKYLSGNAIEKANRERLLRKYTGRAYFVDAE